MICQIGYSLFRIRNYLFPFLYLTLFIQSPRIGPSSLMAFTGILLIISGICIRSVTIGLEYIVRGGKNRQIHAEGLIIGGIYEICRNPMYLGNLIILAGFGFLANSLIFVLFVFPFLMLIYLSIIKAEEDFLNKKFGEMYLVYKMDTPMLFPRLRLLLQIVYYKKLDFKRILRKEYNSWYLYFSGILLLLFNGRFITTSVFLSFFSFLTILWIMVRICKKKSCLNA